MSKTPWFIDAFDAYVRRMWERGEIMSFEIPGLLGAYLSKRRRK